MQDGLESFCMSNKAMLHNAFKDFPNLHPLVVHFPIVLILLAMFAQAGVLLYPKNISLQWLTFYLLFTGSVSAFIAVQTGVHISGTADDKAIDIFETHHRLGLLTQWFSLAATIIRFITIKWFRKKWMELILSLAIFLAGIFVAITGHHGAQLVHIYDVGPQGKNILSK